MDMESRQMQDWQLLGTACNFTLCPTLQMKMNATGDSCSLNKSTPS